MTAFPEQAIYTEIFPGGMLIIHLEDVVDIRITALPDGGCRVESIPEIKSATMRGPVRRGVRRDG